MRTAVAMMLALPMIFSTLGAPGSSLTAAKGGAHDLCRSVSLAKAPDAPVNIRYGSSGGGEEPLAMLWADKASYPNNGKFYSLEPTVYRPSDRITAFQAGQIDAGTISFPALISAVNAGINLRAVASSAEVNKADNEGAFVALRKSGIRSVKDFKGKRIGYYGPNTVSEYWIDSAVIRAGLSTNDISFVALPPPAQEQALRNGQIDVAWLARQFLAHGKAAGGLETIMTAFDSTGLGQPSLLIFFSPQFVEAHPQAYCAWRADYQRSMRRWIADQDDAYPKLIAAKYDTPIAAKAGADAGRDPDGALSMAELTETMKDMVHAKFLAPTMLRPASQLVLPGYAIIK